MSSPEKREHYRIAEELSFDVVEAVRLQLASMVAIHDANREGPPPEATDEPRRGR